MSTTDTETKTAQDSNTGSDYWDRRERRRELKRELRALNGHHRHHGIFVGLLLVLIGCIFLAGNFLNINIGLWWPLFPIAVGIAFLARAFHPWD